MERLTTAAGGSGPRERAPEVLRVLWLIKSLDHGGAERLLETLYRYVDPRTATVEIAYVMRGLDALVPRLERLGARVHCLGARHDLDLTWVFRLRALMRSGRFDILHSHSPLTASFARIALDTVHVYTEHNVWPAYRRLTRLANAATYGGNAVVIAVSAGVVSSIRLPRLVRWPPWSAPPRVVVVHHGADEREVCRGERARRHARALLGLDDDDVVVGTVANFRTEKNHALLLRCTRALAVSRPRLRLVLVGEGPLQEHLRAQVEHHDLGERVLFTGTRDDVQAILPAFDVFALPSLAEGLPISLLEAMAAGLPSVATRVGGVPEVLTDGTQGRLVLPADEKGFAVALAELLDDSERRAVMGAAATRTAALFSPAAAAASVVSQYEAVAQATGVLVPDAG